MRDLSHVGGHLSMTHVDVGALKWLKSLGYKSFLDIGCSVGWQVEAAVAEGFSPCCGIDGDYGILDNPSTKCKEKIFIADLTVCYVQMPTKFDVIWCVEVAEHIEEEYVGNLIDTFACNLANGGLLILTANTSPAGSHHVNLKPESWWIDTLSSKLIHLPGFTAQLKEQSTMEREFIDATGNVYTLRSST